MPRVRAPLALRLLEDRTVPSLLVVTSAADDGSAGTLRAILASAHSGDTITFARRLAGQTITLMEGQLNVTQSVSILGLGADQLAISGNSTSRIFDVTSNQNVKITSLTLTQGLATDGGAILNAGNLAVAQGVFSANVAQGSASGGLFGDEGGRGGAVENQAGAHLAVMNSLFSNNQAMGGPDNGVAFGGAIYNEAGTVSVSNSTFNGNEALATAQGQGTTPATLLGTYPVTLESVAGGGSIWNDGGALGIAASTLTNNEASALSDVSFGATFIGSALGGAVGTGAFFTSSTPNLSIAHSTLSGNLALANASYYSFFGSPFYFPAGIARGGAVEAFAGNVSVSNSALDGNLAQSGAPSEGGAKTFGPGKGAAGGAIDDEVNLNDFAVPLPATLPSLDIAQSTLGNNQAQSNAPGKGSVVTPSADGGALAASRVNAQLRNSTVTGNQATGAPGTNASYYILGGYTANGGYATGGGIEAFQGSLTICGSTVKNNTVAGGGGAAQTSGYGGGLIGGNASGGGIYSFGQKLVLQNSTLSGNQSLGGSDTGIGSRSVLTGSSYGGGLYMGFEAPAYGTSATIQNTVIANNVARGGATFSGGFSEVPNSFGGSMGGGACAILASPQISASLFVNNVSQGGAGEGGAIGGPGVGGGLYTYAFSSAFTVTGTSFIGNQALGGAGSVPGQYSGAGAGGYAWGGALVCQAGTDSEPATIRYCSFIDNVAQGGAGGGGLAAGGNSEGGAVMLADSGTVSFTSCMLLGNKAIGGSGGAATASSAGGNGGNGYGGGLYISAGATAIVHTSLIAGNQADGGAAQASAMPGQGVGGGVYNLGTFELDSFSVIIANMASTSNDNVFGPVIHI